MGKKGSDGKISNSIVALSCAAVLAVYTAGYSRTRDAAERLEEQSASRRVAVSGQSRAVAVSGEPGSSADAPSSPALPAAQPAERANAEVSEGPSEVPVRELPQPEIAAAAVNPVVPEAVTAAPATSDSVPATPAAIVAPAPEPAPAPPPKWKDGTFTGWGTSRHGDIQAEVVVQGGKIVKSGIAQCLTRYSCDIIDQLINQPVQRQSAEVDYVSRATESSDAYYFALVDALEKAKFDK